jgi:hypothetical protein
VNLRFGTPEERFQQKHIVLLATRCWQWIGPLFERGYGQFYVDGRNWRAHKWSYEHLVGPVPEGLQLDHFLFPDRCIGPSCVNPEHLRPVTALENTLRGDTITSLNRAKTHCVHGHEFTPENTRWGPGPRRYCRKCECAKQVRFKARKKLQEAS